MSDNPYVAALDAAKKELALKRADFHRLETDVRRLENTVMALTALTGKPKEIDVAAGITEAVKQAIRLQAPAGLFPTTVKLRLEEAGFPFQDMKNPMPTIHSVLKRLEQSGFIRRAKGGPDGKTAYFWKSDRRTNKPPLTNEDGSDILF